MSKKEFFPPRPDAKPTVYVYELVDVPTHTGLVKVGTQIGMHKEGLKSSWVQVL